MQCQTIRTVNGDSYTLREDIAIGTFKRRDFRERVKLLIVCRGFIPSFDLNNLEVKFVCLGYCNDGRGPGV